MELKKNFFRQFGKPTGTFGRFVGWLIELLPLSELKPSMISNKLLLQLNQWFAPKPLPAKTKTMDFREGGHWYYAMAEPNVTEYWSLTEYLKIKPLDYYTSLDVFSNAEGEINKDLP
jgi:hypothetical protein